MEYQATVEQTAETAAAESSYDDAMLEAFVQKPEKFAWYKKTFAKYSQNGVEAFTWSWSWWAFFAPVWLLLYRKSYLAALGYFVAAIVFSLLPYGALLLMIISGGTVPYFIYKTYRGMVAKVEAASPDSAVRLDTMRKIGGYHTWVVVVALIVYALVVITLLANLLLIGAILNQQAPH